MANNKAANIAIAYDHYMNRKANRPKQKFVAKTKTWKKLKTKSITT